MSTLEDRPTHQEYDATAVIARTNDFLAPVYARMSDEEKSRLGAEYGNGVNSIVAKALQEIDADETAPVKQDLSDLVVWLDQNSPEARFVRDPLTGGTLMVGYDGQLASLQDPVIDKISKGLQGAGTSYIKSYRAAIPLAGPRKGQELQPQEYVIPSQAIHA